MLRKPFFSDSIPLFNSHSCFVPKRHCPPSLKFRTYRQPSETKHSQTNRPTSPTADDQRLCGNSLGPVRAVLATFQTTLLHTWMEANVGFEPHALPIFHFMIRFSRTHTHTDERKEPPDYKAEDMERNPRSWKLGHQSPETRFRQPKKS